MPEILYKEESYKIMGACFEVYKEKGCGFTEPLYQECLGIEFRRQQIRTLLSRAWSLSIKARNSSNSSNRIFVCFGSIIIELKAVSGLVNEHRAQVLNYLHALKLRLGLLVNFGHYPKVEYERIIV